MRSTMVIKSFFLTILFFSSCLKDTAGPSFEEQLARDLALIDAYLEENNIEAEIDPTELRYVIHVEGNGAKATPDQCVTFNYSAKLLSTGEEFESGEDVKSPLYLLIDGFIIGLPLIEEGGSITLYIPSVYGYGSAGRAPKVPGNANLIFDVQLLSITRVNPDTGLCN